MSDTDVRTSMDHQYWEEYKETLEPTLLVDPWEQRLMNAYKEGFARAYAVGYEDGRETSWRDVIAKEEVIRIRR